MTARTIRAGLRSAAADDEGSTMLITIAYAMLALALILVGMAATSMYIERRQLFSLADGAALAAAESFDLEAVEHADGNATPTLSAAHVRQAAVDWVAQAPTVVIDAHVTAAGSPDGATAEVTVAAVWRPDILTPFMPAGVPIEATATARSVFLG